MKLSLSIIQEKLGTIINHANIGPSGISLHLPRPVFYSNGTELISDTLYISAAKSLPLEIKFRLGSSLICIGAPPGSYYNDQLDLLIVDESEDIFVLSNKIHKIYDIFDLWDLDLQQCVHERKPLQEILDISLPILENDMTIMDSDYNVVARTDFVISGFEEEQDKSKIPLEQVNCYKNDKIYNEIKNEREVFIYPAELLPLRTLCKNIFINDEFIFRVIVLENKHKYRNSDRQLLELLSKYVGQVSEYYCSLHHVIDSNLVSQLEKIFMGISYNQIAFHKEIIKMGWDPNDVYYIAYLEPSSQDKYNATLTYFCNIIMRDFKHTFSFIHNGNIVVIVNKSKMNGTQEEFLRKFKFFLRDGNFRAGFSNYSVGLNDLKDFYRQAEIAFEIGAAYNSTIWLHRFSDYVFTYMLNKITDELPARYLCSPVISRLKKYDRENNVEYLKTLQVYLEKNLNAVQTAKELYIHRSTIIYRLERIKEIGKTDLKNADELLHLYISMRLVNLDR